MIIELSTLPLFFVLPLPTLSRTEKVLALPTLKMFHVMQSVKYIHAGHRLFLAGVT